MSDTPAKAPLQRQADSSRAAPAGRPPLRADHVGSLLRPGPLKQAFKQHAAGQLDDARFSAVQDEAIREVIRLQEQTGLKVVTDGEFRRGSYWSRFVERCDGFEIRPSVFRFRDDSGIETEFTAPYAVRRLRRIRPLALDEFEFVHQATASLAKITLPAPSTMHFWRGRDYAAPGLYDSDEEFFDDLTAIYRQEIADLYQAGCRYLQLDEVALAQLCDPTNRELVRVQGNDPDRLTGLYVDAINQCVAGQPSDLIVGVHMCRGNFKGKYLAKGGYEGVAERLFSDARVSHFLLEYDTERAGGFEPLRFLTQGKGAVLGLMSSKLPQLETVDELRRRTDAAGRYLTLDRLALCPQCGFASTVAGNPVTEAVERAKLTRLVEASRAIWSD